MFNFFTCVCCSLLIGLTSSRVSCSWSWRLYMCGLFIGASLSRRDKQTTLVTGVQIYQYKWIRPPACMRDLACNRGPASISTSESGPRPACGTSLVTGVQLILVNQTSGLYAGPGFYQNFYGRCDLCQGRSDGGISVYIPPKKSVTVLFTCGTLTHVLKLQWLVKTYTPNPPFPPKKPNFWLRYLFVRL